MPLSKGRKSIFLGLTLALAAGCPRNLATTTLPTATSEPETAIEFQEDPELQGLRVRLYEVAGAPAPEQRPPGTAALPLSGGETLSLLKRLPALLHEPSKVQELAIRESSLPPPLSGQTVEIPFRQTVLEDPASPAVGGGALSVLRYSPEGEVPLAPNLSLTFSEPMVVLSSYNETAQVHPVELEPVVPGRWRWLGQRTLLFEPVGRMPMATSFRARVSAGLTSLGGAKLEKDLSWTFSTPAIGLVNKFPTSGPTRLEPLIVLGFDQRIDPNTLLPFVNLQVESGDRSVVPPSLVPAGLEAIEREKAQSGSFAAALGRELPERTLVLQPSEPLQRATTFRLDVQEKAPSAEGPRLTSRKQGFTFKTYAPLLIEDQRCGWSDECTPDSEWTVNFSNPLDEKAFDSSRITVEPPLREMKVNLSGDRLRVTGLKSGRTTYTLHIPAGILDVFGQRLSRDHDLSFKVGPADRRLAAPAGLVVLDPSLPPTFPVYGTNTAQVRLRVYSVSPSDWPAYAELLRSRYDRPTRKAPGRLLKDTTWRLGAPPDVFTETRLDLRPYLKDGVGQLLILIDPIPAREEDQWMSVMSWVQVTRIGLGAVSDSSGLRAWATDLASGASLEGAELRLLPGGESVKSGPDGLGLLSLPREDKGIQVLEARKGEDVAFFPQDSAGWQTTSAWLQRDAPDRLRWLVFNDRGLYRPGEELRVKGWIRRFEPRVRGEIDALLGVPTTLGWALVDSQGNEVARGEAPVGALGGFDISARLPPTMNLGSARLTIEAMQAAGLEETTSSLMVEVAEFRRPEFEVGTSVDAATHSLGGRATASVQARYYTGEGLGAAPVTWKVSSSPSSYSPPGWEDWVFGSSPPWWVHPSRGSAPTVTSENLASQTGADGTHQLGMHFEALNPPRCMSVRAEATVLDLNRQAWSSATSFLVHPSEAYVGLRSSRAFFKAGEPFDVQAMVVNIEGAALPGTEMSLEFVRLEWERVEGSWMEVEKDPSACAHRSGDKPQTCTFEAKTGGRHRVRARVRDTFGRPNLSEQVIWISGPENVRFRGLETEQLTLIPDRKEYAAGDTAEILVHAPFFPAEGLLVLARSGIEETRRLRMEQGSTTLKVPILESHVPNLELRVQVLGSTSGSADASAQASLAAGRPAVARGSVVLNVPPLRRALTVSVRPQQPEVEPGGSTTLDLEILDALGKPPETAEAVVIVVDESVLALRGYQLPNPMEVFYAARPGGVREDELRSRILVIDEAALAAGSRPPPSGRKNGGSGNHLYFAANAMKAPPPPSAAQRAGEEDNIPDPSPAQPKMKALAEPEAPIALRSDFRALALFEPALSLDTAGKASLKVQLPDSLTRYRVMVVAVAGGRSFGSGTSSVTARKTLMVRPSAPRFLNVGDQADLPVIVENASDQPSEVSVVLRVQNASLNAERKLRESGRKVTVPARDRVELLFPLWSELPGTLGLQVAAFSKEASDAAFLEIPVWTPATTEAFATYGELDQGATFIPLKAPSDAWQEYGGLEVSTSSTALQALTDALLYLKSYPFECAEQVSARVLAIASLRDVLGAFGSSDLPAPSELEAAVARDILTLAGRQNPDGGFGFWRKGGNSWPFVSIFAAHALNVAGSKGFEVPKATTAAAARYLDGIERHIPSWYSESARWCLMAYAQNVRFAMGRRAIEETRKLVEKAGVDKLPVEALAWLLPIVAEGRDPALAQSIQRQLLNRVSESAGVATFTTSYGDADYLLLHSSRRTDAIVLDALVRADPGSDLIPKVVRGLLAHRVRGRWSSTQENAWVLIAMDRYFNRFEKESPDFVARMWLGAGLVAEDSFKGRSTDRHERSLPMSALFQAGVSREQRLTIAKEGAGRLYWRVGMRHSPKNLVLEPVDAGFVVTRTYEAVDQAGDARRLPDGSWWVRAGARVRVHLELATDTRRTHVALVDPLPAGFEALNPALATTGELPQDPRSRRDRWRWWVRPWYEHENLRDDRVEAFTSLLWDGVWSYSYIARATTPGHFVVPPPRAEEMYAPETFGRGGTDRVHIELAPLAGSSR